VLTPPLLSPATCNKQLRQIQGTVLVTVLKDSHLQMLETNYVSEILSSYPNSTALRIRKHGAIISQLVGFDIL
jgi:hypothetical protein